ncbi:LytR C-terminal domain-containing protein, partial [Patulibacter sp. S7RM1-6]
ASRARTGGPSAGGSGGSSRSIPQIIGVAGVGVVVLVAILFALGVFGGGDDANQTGAEGGGTAPATTTKKASPAFSATDTNVTVLNASGQDGLARTVSNILDNRRFEMGEASNYTVNGQPQSATTSSVEYRAGSGSASRKAAAASIAKALKLSSGAVKPMSADTRSAVQDEPDVVVVVGEDYARKNPQGVQPDSGATSTTPGGASASGSGAAGTSSGGATSSGGGTSSGTSGTAAGGT